MRTAVTKSTLSDSVVKALRAILAVKLYDTLNPTIKGQLESDLDTIIKEYNLCVASEASSSQKSKASATLALTRFKEEISKNPDTGEDITVKLTTAFEKIAKTDSALYLYLIGKVVGKLKEILAANVVTALQEILANNQLQSNLETISKAYTDKAADASDPAKKALTSFLEYIVRNPDTGADIKGKLIAAFEKVGKKGTDSDLYLYLKFVDKIKGTLAANIVQTLRKILATKLDQLDKSQGITTKQLTDNLETISKEYNAKAHTNFLEGIVEIPNTGADIKGKLIAAFEKVGKKGTDSDLYKKLKTP